MMYPRILVISNNSFSKSSNNGRTLGNLFIGWPKEKIAQFCVSTTEPDYNICENYYLLTDRSIFQGLLRLKKGKRCDININLGTEGSLLTGEKRMLKTPWTALMRHVLWSCKRWKSDAFIHWIDQINPELVVIMNSDATFILDIATFVSKSKGIPIVMFNTEGYYFFKHYYFDHSKWFDNSLFKIYQALYKKKFRRMMKRVKLSIHLNSLLKNDFYSEFGGKHIVIYTGSNLLFDSSNLHIETPTFTYLGNFGFDRPIALLEIAEVLQSINPNYKLDIYGKIPSPDIKDKFEASPGIRVKGMIPYEEVIKVMYGSTILFHAEAQTEKYKESLRYGFSTKIADSISCGHPFLMYSSPDIAGAKYIIETGAGWHVSKKKDLAVAINSILNNNEERERVLEVARRTALENHNAVLNNQKFKEALLL